MTAMEPLKLTFVNVGYGEAILLECPDHTRPSDRFVMVIDGGSGEAEEYSNHQSGRIPMADWLSQYGLDHIDMAVMTHIHEDHTCGLAAVLKKWHPDILWQSLPVDFYKSMPYFAPFAGSSPSQDKFRRAWNDYRDICSSLDGRIFMAGAGYTYRPCQDLTISVLAPSPSKAASLKSQCRELADAVGRPDFSALLTALDGQMNNYSLILALEYKDIRILLPGDTNCRGYDDLEPEKLRASIFKLGHHGQKDGIDAALLSAIRPQAVVCCASSDRRYESAHPDAMALVKAQGAKLYFSDCPVSDVPPHQSLTFTIRGEDEMDVQYS